MGEKIDELNKFRTERSERILGDGTPLREAHAVLQELES